MFIKEYLIEKRNNFRLYRFKSKWKRLNKHNYTRVGNIFPLDNVIVGNYTYGVLNIRVFHPTSYKVKIGSFCSIASNVVFILVGEHPHTCLSTYPFNTFFMKKYETKTISKGNIIVDDDVWFGEDVIVLSGVHIGRGAIIGAKSVVTKDVPPYSIYVGNKVIKKRFSNDYITKLMKINYSNLNDNLIKMNIENIYKDIDDSFFESDLYKCLIKGED